ncbi:MAG: hypothetical protein ACKO38_08160, partial [Planctomycetota bacterium]
MTVTLQCKLCRASLLVAEGRAGQPMNCPRCGEQMIVPSFPGSAAATATNASLFGSAPTGTATVPDSPGKDLNA